MEILDGLSTGFRLVLQPGTLLWALAGCLIGNFVGVLPGLGSAGTIALLLPLTFVLPPIPAIVMLAAIFYGSNYGGTITSVLLNIPGEAATAVTALEGYPMAMQGRAGAALGIAAIGSFVGGQVATLILAVGAPLLVVGALAMGPVEKSALMVLALSLVAGLLGKAMTKGLIMAALGLLIGTVGMDPTLGIPRFTFGRVELLDGVNFVAAVMGLFGIGEVLINLEGPVRQFAAKKIGPMLPSRTDLARSVKPIVRGTLLGTALGVIPGANSVIGSFLSYSIEAQLTKHPEEFGHGAIEGVAGPETTNNSFCNANFIPLFSLGIPGTASMAILMGGMMLYGITPGPFLFRDNPDFVWAVIASMFIGNLIMLMLNIPLIGMWIQMLRVPYSLMAPLITILTLIGSYSLTSSVTAVWTTVGFGVVGYLLRKLDFPLAPLVLTMIVGPQIESDLRRSLQISGGDPLIFFRSPISLAFFVAAVAVLVVSGLRAFRATPQRTGTVPL